MTTFEQERWPLHFALAWVLTRDRFVAERTKPTHFHPSLTVNPQDGADRAWHELHNSLAKGCVPAFKIAPKAEIIPPKDFELFDWTDFTTNDNIVVSSNAMIAAFPTGGEPVEFTSDQIGPPVRPEGQAYMSLSDAAYWIATDGGTKRIVARDVSVWRDAFDKLLLRLQLGELHAVGIKRGEATPDEIKPEHFVGVRVDYPYIPTPNSIFFGPKPDKPIWYIKCSGPLIPDEMRDEFSDELFGANRDATGWHKPEWSHLQVVCVDIQKFSPFSKLNAGLPADRNDRPAPQRGG